MGSDQAPIRTCVGCRKRSPKNDLLRIVRTADGPVVDRSAPGRGAYVHLDEVCAASALQNGVLARALHARVGPDEVGRLGDILRTGTGVR